MKKRLILILALVFAFAQSSHAQLEYLSQHPEYLAATDFLCPTGPVELTAAPEGYEPFYISHYGRHGARYAWQSDMYERLNNVFTKAEQEGNLTAKGKEFKRKFDILYPDVRYRVGDLSRKGWQQQKELAERMFSNFPEVLGGDAYVMARTSTSTRCVMTMSSFCLGLKGCNPKMEIFENFGKFFLPAILPQDGSNPFRDKNFQKTPLPFDETWEHYIDRTIKYKPILKRLFKNIDKAVPAKEQWDFVSYLYFFGAGMGSLDTDLDFNDIFTAKERIALYKIDAFQFYASAWPTKLGYMPIVDDIIAKADERIASGQRGAELRFGHDYTFLPLIMILNVDGMGREAKNGDEIPGICPLENVPMGANLHFVFYRSAEDPTVLFKVLLNGKEATLPLETNNWPYYEWEAFKAQF